MSVERGFSPTISCSDGRFRKDATVKLGHLRVVAASQSSYKKQAGKSSEQMEPGAPPQTQLQLGRR